MTIRRLQAGDIPFANEVRALAHWNQSERDWRGYLEFEPEGCFLAEVDGRPAGTATTINYGNVVGWIGMVLVHPDDRRRGIGSELLRHAIAHLQRCGVRSIKLDATPVGKKVYLTLGFVDEYELSRFEGVAPTGDDAPAAEGVVPFTSLDARELARFDTEAFGADRRRVLDELSRRQPDWCFAVHDAAGVRGFLIARPGANAVQVGPWIARDARTAENLLAALFAAIGGRTLFADVLAPNLAGADLLRRRGYRVQRMLTRMCLGENGAPGRPELVYSTSGLEKG